MNTDNDIINQVRLCAKKFVEKEYPSEAPYFDIAWETYMKAFQSNTNTGSDRMLRIKDLRKPTVRDSEEPATEAERSSTIMAPKAIRAFHILLSRAEKMESGSSEKSKQEMLLLLSQKKFPSEFSMKIVDFLMEQVYQ